MGSSEKRRILSGSASPSRTQRASPHSSVPATHTRAGSVIAAPPRAALSGSSSPAPDEYRGRDGGAPSSSSNVSKDVQRSSTPDQGHLPVSPRALRTRIAELERQVDIMESEFRRELDKLSTTESSTAVYWQAKHNVLSQQLDRADSDIRLLQCELERRDAERDEMRAGYAALRRDLTDRDGEIRSLKTQIRGLKEWVSTSTRSNEQTQTSDEVLGEAMAKLGNGLQNWVLVNFRRAKIGKAPIRTRGCPPLLCAYTARNDRNS